MKKLILLVVVLSIVIRISAQEREKKFHVEMTGISMHIIEHKAALNLSVAYDWNKIGSAGLEAMLSDKTTEFGVIQKYTIFQDIFLEQTKDFGLSFGLGLSYIYSYEKLNTVGMDFRAKFYIYLFSDLFITMNTVTTFAKKGDLILPQLGVGLMYRF